MSVAMTWGNGFAARTSEKESPSAMALAETIASGKLGLAAKAKMISGRMGHFFHSLIAANGDTMQDALTKGLQSPATIAGSTTFQIRNAAQSRAEYAAVRRERNATSTAATPSPLAAFAVGLGTVKLTKMMSRSAKVKRAREQMRAAVMWRQSQDEAHTEMAAAESAEATHEMHPSMAPRMLPSLTPSFM